MNIPNKRNYVPMTNLPRLLQWAFLKSRRHLHQISRRRSAESDRSVRESLDSAIPATYSKRLQFFDIVFMPDKVRRYMIVHNAKRTRLQLRGLLDTPPADTIRVYARLRQMMNVSALWDYWSAFACYSVFWGTMALLVLVGGVLFCNMIVSQPAIHTRSFMEMTVGMLHVAACHVPYLLAVPGVVLLGKLADLNKKTSTAIGNQRLRGWISNNIAFIGFAIGSITFIVSFTGAMVYTVLPENQMPLRSLFQFVFLIRANFWLASVWTGMFPFYMLMVFVVFLSRGYYLNRVNPEEAIVLVLLHTLKQLKAQSGQTISFYARKKLANQLEIVASICERNLAQSFGRRSASHDGYRQISKEIASHFREMAQWLFVPKRDTAEFITPIINDYVVALALGDWDSIKRSNIVYTGAKPNPFFHAWTVIRSIIVGALPLVGMALYNYYRPKTPLPEPLYLVSGGWFLVNMLFALDPNLSARIALFKDSYQWFSLPGKDK